MFCSLYDAYLNPASDRCIRIKLPKDFAAELLNHRDIQKNRQLAQNSMTYGTVPSSSSTLAPAQEHFFYYDLHAADNELPSNLLEPLQVALFNSIRDHFISWKSSDAFNDFLESFRLPKFYNSEFLRIDAKISARPTLSDSDEED